MCAACRFADLHSSVIMLLFDTAPGCSGETGGCVMPRNYAQRSILATLRNNLIAAGLLIVGVPGLAGSALALSELQQDEMQLPDEAETTGDEADTIERRDLPPPGSTKPAEPQSDEPGEQETIQPDADADDAPPAELPHAQRRAITVPLPDPVVIPRDPQPQQPAETSDDEGPLPEIFYDLSLLPEPVQRMRELIVEACLSGDIERLRPLISTGKTATQLSFGDLSGDPIAFLRELSGDAEGHEILAILYEVFSAGYVHLDEGTSEEIYVWPYFFAVPLDSLTGRQRVELFKIVTAGDYEDMKSFGAYIFYRAGISPEGQWLFFVAGD